MKNKFTKAFTLVELIVVITILAVLATIGFISMTSYSISSRDAVRLTDLKNISKAFEFQKTKDIKLPLPDKKIDISASGSIFQYQGLLSENILAQNNIHGGGKDPQTGEYFGYAVNKNLDKFQIITFLENEENVVKNNLFSEIYADNSNKFPKTSGDNLAILLNKDTSEVISSDDGYSNILADTTTDTFKVIISDTVEEGNNQVLKKIESIAKYGLLTSCKNILDNNSHLLSKNGIYTISPKIGEVFEVYCDMTTDGGGWTVIGSDGLEALTQSLYLESTIPTPQQKGLIKYFIENPINDNFSTLRALSISNNNLYAQYAINLDWIGKLVLANADKGYLYSHHYNDGFSGGKNSPHKCNFSLVVIGDKGCEESHDGPLPYNGVKENAQSGYISPTLGSIAYSWQFRTSQHSTIFRLGWIPPTNNNGNYYNNRESAYIMVR